MLRGVAMLVGLLAALPALAGEMSVDEARHFVIGKTVQLHLLRGHARPGRVYADGSVVGSIQIQGEGTAAARRLAARHHPGQRRVGLRLAARPADGALLQSRAHRREQLPRLDLRARLCLLRRSRAIRAARASRIAASARSRSLLRPSLRRRQRELAASVFAGKIMHVVVAWA